MCMGERRWSPATKVTKDSIISVYRARNPAEMKLARVVCTEVVTESLYFPVIHPLAEKCMTPVCRVQGISMLTAFSIWSSCSFGYGLFPSCNEHVAIPQPQFRQALELSQTYPSFVLWTILFHGLFNRIPKMLAEQVCLYYGLQKSESPRRKPSMITNRRSLKEPFNSSAEWIVFMS